MRDKPLNPRQQQVLSAIVDHYVVKAEPVSSKILSLNPIFRASSATLRNTMAELEDMGLVEQPHTSAGRLPTDLGYRTYVDELMESAPLTEEELQTLNEGLSPIADAQEALGEAARLLGKLTGLLGMSVSPAVAQGTFRHLALLPLNEGRVMVVLTASGMVFRTVLVDKSEETSIFRLESLARRLNAEMQGQPVSHLNSLLQTPGERDMTPDEAKALAFFGRSISKLLDLEKGQNLQVSGTHNLIRQRDFERVEDVDSILELLESKITLVHFLRQQGEHDGVHVTIGEERNEGKLFRSVSIVSSSFRMGDSFGIVGVMGPKRMPYSRLIALVNHAALRLNRSPEQET